MGICRVTNTTDNRLNELIQQLGQYEGLRQFLNEKTGMVLSDDLASSTAPTSFDKLTEYLKGQLRIKQGRRSRLEPEIAKLRKSGDKIKLKAAEAIRTKLIADIDTLREKIQQYEMKADADVIYNIAMSQLDWVNQIFSKPDVTISELNEVNFILDMWGNIKDIMYGEEEAAPKPMVDVFNQISNRVNSEDMVGNWYRISMEMLSQMAKYEDASDLFEEFTELKDLGFITTQALGLSHTGNKLITFADKLMRNANTRSELEIRQWEKSITEKFKFLRDNGKNIDLFWQKDKNGNFTGNLTNRYSQLFYDERTKMKRKLDSVIEDKNAGAEARKNAYAEYHKWHRENTESIDIRYFIDDNYTSKDGVNKDMYIKYLTEQFGDKRTNEIIAQAMQGYEKYLEAYNAIKDGLDDQVATGILSRLVADEQLNDFVSKNSPIVWLNQNDPYVKGEPKRVYTQGRNRYIVTKPKRIVNGKETPWYDSSYEAIENDADMLEVYNFIRNFMGEMMSHIPSYLTREQDINAAFLPRVTKDAVMKLTLTDMVGGSRLAINDWLQSLTTAEVRTRFEDIDPVTKQPYKSPPVRFLTNIPVEERSTDLEKSLIAFSKMAVNYKWMSSIEDELLLVNRFISNMANSQSRKQITPEGLSNYQAALNYAQDVLLYGKSKDDEMVINAKLMLGNTYIPVNPVNKASLDSRYKKLINEGNSHEVVIRMLKEEFGNEVEIVSKRKKNKYLKDMIEEIEEQLYNKEISEEQRDARIQPLVEEMESLGRKFVGSRILDKGLRFNQALALGLNPFSAINNYMFGILSNMMWAAGKTDFTSKEMTRAFGLMWKSSLTLKNKELDKVANLMIKFNMLQESLDFKSESENESLRKLKNAPYALLRRGDYFIKGQTFMALMLHTQIADVNGNQRSLFEAFDNNGNWKTEEFGDDKGWNGDITNTEEMGKFLEFKNKGTILIKKLHGNFDSASPVLYKKKIFGRMLGQFRFSWMAEGFAQRFSNRDFDDYLGRDAEGRYYTMYNTLGWKKSIKILAKLALRQKTAFAGVRAQDRAIVEENMRRNLMEIYLYAVMFTIYLLIKGAVKRDDDDDDKKEKMALNMLNRIMADTTFYMNPNTMITLWKDPLPILSIATKATRAFNSAEALIVDDELTDGELEQKWANIASAFPYLNQYSRFRYMSNKVF